MSFFFFFFNDTATTEIYTLSLHDALPIFHFRHAVFDRAESLANVSGSHNLMNEPGMIDRKSTRLNSSHANISYAVFCLKKKKVDSQIHNRISFLEQRAVRSTERVSFHREQ